MTSPICIRTEALSPNQGPRGGSDATTRQTGHERIFRFVLKDRRGEVLTIFTRAEAQRKEVERRADLWSGLMTTFMLVGMFFTTWQFIVLPVGTALVLCVGFGECPDRHEHKLPGPSSTTTSVSTTTQGTDALSDHFQTVYYILTAAGVVFVTFFLIFRTIKHNYDIRHPPAPVIPPREDKILKIGKNLSEKDLENFFKLPFVVAASVLMIPLPEEPKSQGAENVMHIPVHRMGPDMYLDLSGRNMRFSLHSVPKGRLDYQYKVEQTDGGNEKSYHPVEWVGIGKHCAFADFYKDLRNLCSPLETQEFQHSAELDERVKKFLDTLFENGVFLNVWRDNKNTKQVVFCKSGRYETEMLIDEMMLSFKPSYHASHTSSRFPADASVTPVSLPV